MYLLKGRSLQDGADNHDPASNADTALSAQAIGSQEGDNGAQETSDVVDGCYDTFEIGVWVFERVTEGVEANNGTENTLVIAEELNGIESAGMRSHFAEGHTKKATPQHVAIEPRRAPPLMLPQTMAEGGGIRRLIE